MKKIIALAVASAFVAPAYAADVSVSGFVGYFYQTTDSAEDTVNTNEQAITVSGTEEYNGVTVTGTVNIVDDTGDLDSQGTNLAIAGEFGKLELGDVSGALDATGDWTDVSPQGGAYAGDGSNMAINYVLPTIAPGLTIEASISPAGDSNVGEDHSLVDDASAFSVTYDAGRFQVYAGSESEGSVREMDSYGIKGSVSGVSFAYEAADETDSTGDTRDITGMMVSYSMGDTTVMYESQEEKNETDSQFQQKETVLSIVHNFGPLKLYVSIEDEDEAVTMVSGETQVDSTYIGVDYSF